jgi:hypothetical protein
MPRLSLSELVRPSSSLILGAMPLSSDPQALEETRLAVQGFIESFNVLGFAATMLNAITRVPTLLAVDGADIPSPLPGGTLTIPVNSSEMAVLFFVPLFLLGLLAVAVYFEWIAQGARPLQSSSSGASLLRMARLWLRLILYSFLLLALFIGIGMFLVALQLVFNSPELAAFATLIATVGLFWLIIYFFFLPSAMAVSDIGVRQAIRRSTVLFRSFFWSTLALVALTVFLTSGLAIVWDGLLVGSFAILGILGSAFLGTALIAASMLYYQDRMNVLERHRTSAKPK